MRRKWKIKCDKYTKNTKSQKSGKGKYHKDVK